MQDMKWKNVIIMISKIVLGCVFYAIAVDWLFVPNDIVVGGFTGIAQILNHFFPALPIGLTVVVLNIPLFIIGIRLQGMKLLYSSLFAMTLGSVLIDVLDQLFVFQPMDNLLLACIFGGVLMGASLGLELSVGATTGGSDLAARLLKYKLRHVSMGKLCLAVDICVVVIYSIVFQSVYTALYGIVAMYICSLSMDSLIYGGTQAKMAYIISDKNDQIRKRLLEMDLGATVLDGKGGWSGIPKDIILCTCRRKEIAAVKEAVISIDKDAFVIMSDAYEVLGEGFSSYSSDSL